MMYGVVLGDEGNNIVEDEGFEYFKVGVGLIIFMFI